MKDLMSEEKEMNSVLKDFQVWLSQSRRRADALSLVLFLIIYLFVNSYWPLQHTALNYLILATSLYAIQIAIYKLTAHHLTWSEHLAKIATVTVLAIIIVRTSLRVN